MAIHRKIRYWKLRSTELQLGDKTVLMGVLNVTPDSFSDGGKYLDPDRAYARALQMEEEGADIIDIGAESTRPDSKRISADEEWQRLVPVLKRLRDKLRIPLSIDTYKSEIAERALDYGIEIINDPSGLTFDPNVAKVAAQGDAGLILNHMRGTPETWGRLAPLPDIMGAVVRELDAMASRARLAGVEKIRIALDPGLGFGKRKEQNSEVIAHLGRLVALDYPVMVGASRKAFLMTLAEAEPGYATAAAVTASILNGADIVRVHDVKAMKAVALVADEISRTGAAAARTAELEADKAADAAAAKQKRPKKDWLEPERRQPMRAPLAKVEPPPPPPVVEAAAPPVAEERKVDEPEKVEPEVIAAAPEVVEAAPVEAPRAETAPPERKSEGGDRPVPKVFNKPKGDKPAWQPRDRPQGDRPRYGQDRPQGDRPRYGQDRPQADRPRYGQDRPQGDRPRYAQDRPQGDRPSYGQDRPRYNNDRPQGDRPTYGNDRPRYNNDRPQGDRPRYGGDRPQGGRPPFRPQGDRPPFRNDRPQGDRPPFKPRFGGGDRPSGGEWKDRGPRPGGDSRPPRGDGGSSRPPGGGGRPPFGDKDRPPNRPFRKRP